MMESEGATVGPEEMAHRLCDLLEWYPGDRPGVRRILDGRLEKPEMEAGPPPTAVPVPELRGEMPKGVLTAVGHNGMVLAEGYVCVLAAEGGIGKSSLVGTVALETAMDLGGGVSGIFSGAGGRVLLLTYEDAAAVARWRLEELAEDVDRLTGDGAACHALSSVFVMDMESWPLYGPSDFASYASRPGPLRGWEVFWSEVERIQPKLVIIDPVLKAYVGESGGVSPVREFLGAMRHRLRVVCREGAGLLVTAHSTKAARGSRGSKGADPYDPGQVSGSAAWVDEPRGVLTMTWGENGTRNLSVVKANLGPSRITLRLRPVADSGGMVVGFRGEGGWRKSDLPAESPAGNGVVQNGMFKTGGIHESIAR